MTEIVTRASSARSTTKRQQRTVEEKPGIVEETLVEGTSVALVSRAHGINANQVFGWRRLYLAGRLGGSGAIKLLPAQVTALASLAQRDGSMFGGRPGSSGDARHRITERKCEEP